MNDYVLATGYHIFILLVKFCRTRPLLGCSIYQELKLKMIGFQYKPFTLCQQTRYHVLGTQSKKNKYENSEHVPISFDPPSSEGYREQKDSELWYRF